VTPVGTRFAAVAMELAGARVLLTGASSGIGAATAPVLAARGAVVAVTARRADRLDELVASLPGEGHVAIAADLADPGAAERVVADAAAAVGPLDVVVHNAGMPKRRAVTALTIDEVTATMRLNHEVPVRMTLATLPGMLDRGRGCHVYVASLGGRLGVGGIEFAVAHLALLPWRCPGAS